jgi:hypothetical protein
VTTDKRHDTPRGESPDEWYEREKAAFIAWWESEGQKKFGETPTLAAGAGWLARAEAMRSETALTDEKGRPMTYWGGAASPDKKCAVHPDAAWPFPTKPRSVAPSAVAPMIVPQEQFDAAKARVLCDWPTGEFRIWDDPDPHKPCFLVCPDGAMVGFSHHNGEGVDKARVQFIADACNAALAPPSAIATRKCQRTCVAPEGMPFLQMCSETIIDATDRTISKSTNETKP